MSGYPKPSQDNPPLTIAELVISQTRDGWGQCPQRRRRHPLGGASPLPSRVPPHVAPDQSVFRAASFCDAAHHKVSCGSPPRGAARG